MKYGSVCSGIEAATVAWHDLGWEPQWFSEVEPFPCKVLKHHYPLIPNLGDMTKLRENKTFNESTIDLLVGGTPCQAFSIAGLRKGLDDERGNLSLEYIRLLESKRPRWFVWENVPGVLSSNEGRDFATILSGWTGRNITPQKFTKAGIIEGDFYSIAWRILDAQYTGVPQRRRRVFVVGYLGNDWRPPAAVLFERESLPGDTQKGRKAGKETAGKTGSSAEGASWPPPIARCLSTSNERIDYESETFVPVTIDCRNSVANNNISGTPVCFQQNSRDEVRLISVDGQITGALMADAGAKQQNYVAQPVEVAPTLTAYNLDSRSPQSEEQQRIVSAVFDAISIARRLTPVECERLQGFPDNYTNIPGAKDGPRYKAIGNSMAVPCMKWIGKRIKVYRGIDIAAKEIMKLATKELTFATNL